MKNFQIIDKVLGYYTKPDLTNTDARFIVSGSQNVLINDQELVESRNGYTRLGATNAALTAIRGSFDWATSTGQFWAVRFYDDELEVYVPTLDTVAINAWHRITNGISTTVAISFASWFDTAEDIDQMLYVIQDATLNKWGGGVAVALSTGTNTLTKAGTTTWARNRFYTVANRTIINTRTGVEFAYTGGTGTTTLTGVTPDPAGAYIVANDVFVQKVVTHADTPAASLTNNLIAVLNQQVYVADLLNTEIRVSSTTSVTSYTFSSPRVPGEGATLTPETLATALIPHEQRMYISGGDNDWYITEFSLSDDNAREILTIRKLSTGKGMACFSRDMFVSIGDEIIYLNRNQELISLRRAEELELPKFSTLSDSIKPDFDAEDFTNGHLFFNKNRVLISAPANNKVYIYQFLQRAGGEVRRFWQAPQLMPIRRFAIIDNSLHGHSSLQPETYELFEGANDNGAPINFKIHFAYNSYRDRANLKQFNEYFIELYIKSNTTVEATLEIDYKGASNELFWELIGTESAFLFNPADDNSLGINSLGTEPIGGASEAPDELSKYRRILLSRPAPFFEIQAKFESSTADGKFKIVSHGPAVRKSRIKPFYIKS